jgi:hypothetical protein
MDATIVKSSHFDDQTTKRGNKVEFRIVSLSLWNRHDLGVFLSHNQYNC